MSEYSKNSCMKCSRIFTNTKSLQNHMKKIHPIEDNNSVNRYKCFECERTLSNLFSLKRHVEKCHPSQSLSDIRTNKKSDYLFSCICGNNFTYKHHFEYHKRICHNESKKRKTKKCPLCEYMGSDKKEMISHFREKHKITVKTTEHQFASFENFKDWKTKMEAETYSWYIRNSTKSDRKYEKSYYYCHRSGQYKTQGTGLRKLKMQGSKKINGYCPAGIYLLKQPSGHCKIVLTETHVGHDNEIEHTLLTSSERSLLEKKVASKIPFEKILSDIHSKRGEKPKRLDLVIKKDLFNIRDRLKVKAIKDTEPDEEITTHDKEKVDKEHEESVQAVLNLNEEITKKLTNNKIVLNNSKEKESADNGETNIFEVSSNIYTNHNDILSRNFCSREFYKNTTINEKDKNPTGETLSNMILVKSPGTSSDEWNYIEIILDSKKSSQEDLYNDITATSNGISQYLFEDLVNTVCNEPINVNSEVKPDDDSDLISNSRRNNEMENDSISNEIETNTFRDSNDNVNLDENNSLDEEKKCILESFLKQLSTIDSIPKLHTLRTIVDSLSLILNASEKTSGVDFSINL